MEQVRKSSEKITKPTIKKCEVEKEQLGYGKYLISLFHFSITYKFRRVRGVCTPQGSCQVLGNHFVFQGGCGEASRWATIFKTYLWSNFFFASSQGGGLFVYQRMFHVLWSCFIMKRSQDIALWVVTVGQGWDFGYMFLKSFTCLLFNRHETKLLHPDCREQSEQNHQISTRSTEYQKN